MKLQKKINKQRLIELKLLKTKTYKKNYKFNFLKLNDISFYIKTILHVVYKYHTNNKKILFVGTPIKAHKQIEKLLANTKHTAIPESVWLNGLLTNKRYCLKYIVKDQSINPKSSSRFLLEVKNKNDLIVLFNNPKNSMTKEIENNQVPIVSFISELNPTSKKNLGDYKIISDFNFTSKTKRDNFLYEMLKTIFKKANNINKTQKKYIKPYEKKRNQNFI
jgi:hypothetical protein